jgi:outer membrane lipoprotein-sorting protein
MNKWQRFGLAVVWSIGMVFGGQAMAPAADGPGSDYLGISIAQITDPVAQAAATEIQQKQAKVQDYQCVLNTTHTLAQGEITVSQGTEMFKRPTYVRWEQKTVQSTLTESLGSVALRVNDGKTLWLQDTIKLPSDRVAKKQTSKLDYPRLKNVDPPTGHLLSPFPIMTNTCKLILLREDKEVWLFSDGRSEITVGKNDGLLRALTQTHNGKVTVCETFSDIKVNAGIAQGTFVFTPLPGEVVKDVTDSSLGAPSTAGTQSVPASATPNAVAETIDPPQTKKFVEQSLAKVKADMRTLSVALEAYTIDWNKCPPSLIPSLTTPVAYVTEVPIDPFTVEKKRPYNYRTVDPKNWELWSIGPDGKDDQGGIWYDPAKGFVSPGDIVRTNKGQLTP